MNTNIYHFSALFGEAFLEPFWVQVGNLEKTHFVVVFCFGQNGFWQPKGAFLRTSGSGGGTFGSGPAECAAPGRGFGSGANIFKDLCTDYLKR